MALMAAAWAGRQPFLLLVQPWAAGTVA